MQQQTTSATKIGMLDSVVTSGLIAAMSILPTSVYAQPEVPTPHIAFKTPGEMRVRFKSEVYHSKNVGETLRRLVNYLVEEEQIIPTELAMTSRKHFREMYDRF